MIRYIDVDEWTVFTLRPEKYDWDWNDEIHLSEAEIEDFERVLREFKAWQERLDEVLDAAIKRRKSGEAQRDK